MRVEKKNVLVGIIMDGQSRQLLNWAIVKVAEPGDCVIAVHVVRNLDYASKSKPILEGYLEVYEGICNIRKVDLKGQILTGSSIIKVLIAEAKKHTAMALVLGTHKHSGLWGRVSKAKHCAKRLPTTTNVISIQDGRIVYRSCNNNQPTGLIEDPKPSFTRFDSSRELNCEFRESEVDTKKSISEDSGREDAAEVLKEADFKNMQGVKRSLTRSLSLFTGEPCEQKLGWPLLHRANSGISQILHARNMSVVEWVMGLPDRSPRIGSCSSFIGDIPSERSNSDIEDESFRNFSSPSAELQHGFLNINSSDCKLFSLEVLKSWTSKFSLDNLIGKGGSNCVYKGILPDGKPIAVKVLKSSKEAWKEFSYEMEIISSLKHKNITPLLGICIEDNSLISVYDYFPKGTLEESLHGKNKDGTLLPWEKRFNIAIGIAEALSYLHNETMKPVIHRDVKSSNILLSIGFEPQLSDFGLAIWGPTSSSFLTEEDVVGTFGYLAPEYFMYGKLSDKVDVYAFGVILLELISGRKPISSETDNHESLVDWAKAMIESGNVNELLDPNLQGKFDEPQLEKMVWAASLCITRAARLRPKMNQILKILKGDANAENFLNICCFGKENSESQENIDDEVYPSTSVKLHLNLALLDADDDTTSYSSSTEQINSLSLQEHLKGRWSRSSSFD